MSSEKSPEELLKAFVKQCKKITSTFELEELKRINQLLVSSVLDSDGKIDINAYKYDAGFYDNLFAMLVIADYRNAEDIITELDKQVSVEKKQITPEQNKQSWLRRVK